MKKVDEAAQHEFSEEYLKKKKNILEGLKDAEGRKKSKNLHVISSRLVRIAAILLGGMVIVPVSVQAAMNLYEFSVKYKGRDAEVVISKDGSTGDNAGLDSVNDRSNTEEPGTYEIWNEDVTKDAADGEWLEGDDGFNYYIETDRQYYDIEFDYLPDGMVRQEEGKWATDYGALDGFSVCLFNWLDIEFKTLETGISSAKTYTSGAYQYVVLTRDDVTADFDREVFIPIKDRNIIVQMYVTKAIDLDELSEIIRGMSIVDKGENYEHWIPVYDLGECYSIDEDDQYFEWYADLYEESAVNTGDELWINGCSTLIGDVTVSDRLTDDDLNNIFVHKEHGYMINLADTFHSEEDRDYFVDTYLNEDGSFKKVDCQYVISDEDGGTSYGDRNESRLVYVSVDVTYSGVNTSEFYFLRAELNIGEKDEDGQFVDSDIRNYIRESDGYLKAMSEEVLAGACNVNGERVSEGNYMKNGKNQTYVYKLGFFVDESELDKAYIDFCDRNYNKHYLLKVTDNMK